MGGGGRPSPNKLLRGSVPPWLPTSAAYVSQAMEMVLSEEVPGGPYSPVKYGPPLGKMDPHPLPTLILLHITLILKQA